MKAALEWSAPRRGRQREGGATRGRHLAQLVHAGAVGTRARRALEHSRARRSRESGSREGAQRSGNPDPQSRRPRRGAAASRGCAVDGARARVRGRSGAGALQPWHAPDLGRIRRGIRNGRRPRDCFVADPGGEPRDLPETRGPAGHRERAPESRLGGAERRRLLQGPASLRGGPLDPSIARRPARHRDVVLHARVSGDPGR